MADPNTPVVNTDVTGNAVFEQMVQQNPGTAPSTTPKTGPSGPSAASLLGGSDPGSTSTAVAPTPDAGTPAAPAAPATSHSSTAPDPDDLNTYYANPASRPSPGPTQSTIVPVDAALPEEQGPSLLSRIGEGISDAGQAVKDEFTNFANQFSEMQVFDTYYVPEASVVAFRCETKRFSDGAQDTGITVQGLLAESFTFSMSSKWDTKALGGILDAEKFLSPFDNASQGFLGISINQPVLARKRWGGTDPLESTVKVKFIARNRVLPGSKITTEKQDVYDKVVALLQLMMPREWGSIPADGASGILSAFVIPGPTPFGSGVGDAINAIANKFNHDTDFNTAGDKVKIKIGNIVSIDSAYLTKVNCTFSKALGPTGYPLAADVVVSFCATDAPYLRKSPLGSYMDYEGNNPLHVTALNPSDLIPGGLSALGTVAKGLAADAGDLIKGIFTGDKSVVDREESVVDEESVGDK